MQPGRAGGLERRRRAAWEEERKRKKNGRGIKKVEQRCFAFERDKYNENNGGKDGALALSLWRECGERAWC